MTLTSLVAWGEQLEQTRIGAALAESIYAFPIIEGIHLIGLSVAIGLLFVTDLRLAGWILKRVPATAVLRQLRPWVLGGFAVILISGSLLFMAEASALIASPAFAFKLVFILLAGINAAVFEFVSARRPGALDAVERLPAGVRFGGLASLGLWSLVIICGRLIPYLPNWT